MINWYHRHLKDISVIQRPLSKLTSVSVPWNWTDETEEAFLKVKDTLRNAQVLAMPVPGWEYRLYADASNVGLGAVLVQYDERNEVEKHIMFLSRPLTKNEVNYSTTEKECLAMIWALKRLRGYVGGMPVTVYT